jgi:CRP-like cAMP-binding protein
MAVATQPADLTKVSLFRGLREDDLREVARRAEMLAFPAETTIIREGEAADSLFLILSGKVKIYLTDPNGKKLVVDIRRAGQYVGEMMLDDKPRSASVRTLEPSEFAVISRADFKSLLARNPEVALALIRNLIRMTRGQNVKTLQDVRTRDQLQVYLEQLKSTKVQDLPSVRRWEVAKRWILITLLVFAIMQFYFLDVLLNTMSLRSITLPGS